MSLVDMHVPSIGESITEVTLAKWLKGNGDFVQRDEAICEFESDKATLELPAEESGKLIWEAKEGDDLPIGALVARIDTSVQAGATQPATKVEIPNQTTQAETPSPIVQETPKPESSDLKGFPSPAAAKMMADNNIVSADVKATGRDGRIRKEDVLLARDQKASAPTVVTEAKVETSTEVSGTAKALTIPTNFSREIRKEKMSRMRRTIASRLVSAKNNTAMLTTFNELDMTGIIELRKTYQDRFVEKYGIKLGFMSLFAKACAKVLLEMPEVNAKLEEDSLVLHNYADISIAISTPTGLVVPPVHNVESLSLSEIEYKIKELAEKARNGKLSLEEMSGGTFTITNGGIFGSMMSTPIINEPQSAILGMHATIERPVAINGKIEIRPMMYLAMSYDHRVIDGSSSVTFLVKVKHLLEDPMSLMLGL